VIRQHGWSSRSIGEDLEQSLALIRAGERIHFVGDARVCAEEAVDLRQGYSQRRRWAAGRLGIGRTALAAVCTGLRRRRLILVDAGAELLMPTYSMTVNLTLLALVLGAFAGPGLPILALGAMALAGQLLEAVAALCLMRPSWRFVLSLGFAPVFLVWKLSIDLTTLIGWRPRRWVRTARSGAQPGPGFDP
jgi:cellulose synthase/poly-beta-1,6-N-acetylglucosamine synthase-like glycosyltransferase